MFQKQKYCVCLLFECINKNIAPISVYERDKQVNTQQQHCKNKKTKYKNNSKQLTFIEITRMQKPSPQKALIRLHSFWYKRQDRAGNGIEKEFGQSCVKRCYR